MSLSQVTWASCEGLDDSSRRCFDHVNDHEGSHAEKLNCLAEEITYHAADDDLLMFLDGDAFPIRDPLPLIETGLAEAPLLAVRRDENGGDPQPHPSFCVATVATWRDLPGDWSRGRTWSSPEGTLAKDVGGVLLDRLQVTETPWTPVLRSNQHDLHPLFYGIYGNTIYHHGAGFREPFSRADLESLRSSGKVDDATEVFAVYQRNWHQSIEVFERIRKDDPGWLTELR